MKACSRSIAIREHKFPTKRKITWNLSASLPDNYLQKNAEAEVRPFAVCLHQKLLWITLSTGIYDLFPAYSLSTKAKYVIVLLDEGKI